MNDLVEEGLIPLRAAADMIPSRVRGKKVNLATVYRWANAGLLETTKISGGRFSSPAAVGRFLRRNDSSRSDHSESFKTRDAKAAAELKTKFGL